VGHRGIPVERGMSTAPVELAPATVAAMARRAGRDDFDRWAAQAKGCGYCSRPVRLRGSTITKTAAGRVVDSYCTDGEPDRVAYVRCGNRRAAVCPSCSHEYQGDMWHLLYAGTAGGMKGVPKTVAEHPMVFATLTAPGFGPVHTTRQDAGRGRGSRCRPRRGHPRCVHGLPAWCDRVHAEGEPCLGEPLCPDCYDYTAHVAFNYHAPELWRRFTIDLPRVLAARLGLTAAGLRRVVRVQYAKVGEFQRRGVLHFHALIRLDGPGPDFPASAIDVTAEQLAAAVVQAAGRVQLRTAAWAQDAPSWLLRFGSQVDARPVHGAANREGSRGDVHPEMVAAYVAKYATKAADDFGLDQRIRHLDHIEHLDVSEHVRRIINTAAEIAVDAQLTGCEGWDKLGDWLHMLGFRGHFATKSRSYSTTLTRIRGERRAWRETRRTRQAPDAGHAVEFVDDDQADEDDSTLVIKTWEFVGMGWLSTGDAALAASAAARAREHREAARDAIADEDDYAA
jgi:hypothetical protein